MPGPRPAEEADPHILGVFRWRAPFGGRGALALPTTPITTTPPRCAWSTSSASSLLGLNLLAKFSYQQSVQFFPALYGNFFEVSNKLPTNPVVHELKLVGFARASAYIDEFRPDAVISTFPVAGGVVSDIKAEPTARVGDDHHGLRCASGVAPSGDRLLLRRLQGGPRGPGAPRHPLGPRSWSRGSPWPRSSPRSSIAQRFAANWVWRTGSRRF